MSETLTRRSSKPAYRREPTQKRELLMTAARELFSSQGYDETPTAEIAQRAGVSEGILFHHFGSKRELFARLAEDYGRNFAAATMPDDPAQMTAESIVRSAFEFAEEDRALFRLFAVTGPRLDGFDGTPTRDVVVAVIRANLERGMLEGKTHRGDARVMAELQFAVVDGAYRAWCRSADPSRKEDYIAEAIRSMQLMLAPAASERD